MPVTTRGQLNRLRDQAAFDFSASIWNTELTVHVNDRTPYTRTDNPSIYFCVPIADSAYSKYFNYPCTGFPKSFEGFFDFLDNQDLKKIRDANLPRELLYMYYSWECEGLSSTFYHIKWRSWKFLSIIQILDTIEHYRRNGQHDLVDIAFWKEQNCYYIFKLCYIPSRDKFVVLQDLRDRIDTVFAPANYNFTPDLLKDNQMFDYYEAFQEGGIFNTKKPNPLANDVFFYRYNLLRDDEMMTHRPNPAPRRYTINTLPAY